MGFFDLFQSRPKFQPTNLIEEMLATQQERKDPEAFFGLLSSRKLLVVTHGEGADDRLSLVTRQIDEKTYAYVYTSEAALNFISHVRKQDIEFAELAAIDLFECLAGSGLGFVLNSDAGNLTVVGPSSVSSLLGFIQSTNERTPLNSSQA